MCMNYINVNIENKYELINFLFFFIINEVE